MKTEGGSIGSLEQVEGTHLLRCFGSIYRYQIDANFQRVSLAQIDDVSWMSNIDPSVKYAPKCLC